jgi:hypothetical protein
MVEVFPSQNAVPFLPGNRLARLAVADFSQPTIANNLSFGVSTK